MAWARLDDRAGGSVKLLALSDGAWRLWGNGLIFCQAQLTDGFIPELAIRTFGVRARHLRGLVDELCRPLVPGKGPLWHRVGPGAPDLACHCLAGTPGEHAPEPGYQVHDYLDWNESRVDVLARRAQADRDRETGRDRVRRFRDRLRAQDPTPDGSDPDGGGSDGNAERNALHEPCNAERNTECNALRNGPPHTPPVRTTSTTTYEDHKITAPRRARRRDEGSWGVYLRLAHEAWRQSVEVDHDAGYGNVSAWFKLLCRQAGITYTGDSCRKAVEAAEAARARRKARA